MWLGTSVIKLDVVGSGSSVKIWLWGRSYAHSGEKDSRVKFMEWCETYVGLFSFEL